MRSCGIGAGETLSEMGIKPDIHTKTSPVVECAQHKQAVASF